jgi:hypothetical protein
MDQKERERCLTLMKNASDMFYLNAVNAGNHAFIEFTGILNEYLKICQDLHAAGIDFTQCNRHTGKGLEIQQFQVDYLNEKLECIFNGRIKVVKS